jgi:uncharacterized repeat protein (TIGR03803 family)
MKLAPPMNGLKIPNWDEASRPNQKLTCVLDIRHYICVCRLPIFSGMLAVRHLMKIFRGFPGMVAFATALAVALALPCRAATINVLYSFAGGTGDGAYPYGSLTAIGSMLYGMTNQGGAVGNPNGNPPGDGVIFSIDTAAGVETVLHSFAGSPSDGANPGGSFTQSVTDPYLLYAVTGGGGTGGGSLISYNAATGAESMLLNSFSVDEFTGPAIGNNLLQSGNLLYGYAGGLYSYDLSSGVLTPLHRFTGYPDAIGPTGTPVLIGDTIYGTSQGGGTGPSGNRDGTIWSYNLGTGVETVLQSFDGDIDGASPGSIIASGDILYGATDSTIFSYDTADGAFQTLVSGINAGPGSLLLDGSTLYGESDKAGPNGDIFAFNLNTDTFDILGSFDIPNGSGPMGGLTLVGSALYGMTEAGGTDGRGVIFSIAIPEPTGASGLTLAGACILLRRRRGAPSRL